MQDLKVTLLQSDIIWNDIAANLALFKDRIDKIEKDTDIIVLPEMFTTGFNMNPKEVYETVDSETVVAMQKIAKQRQCVLTGSLLLKENDKFYNRLFWFYPEGHYETYDKKHLFSFVDEDKVFTAGTERKVVNYKGVNFLLITCYDLRFPVWCKNLYADGVYNYDAIICVANWPEVRGHVWRLLLQARAVENQAYVVGVNRVGEDINGVNHSGDSMVVCPKGEIVAAATPGKTEHVKTLLDMNELQRFRKRFFAAADWDNFIIK